MKSAVVSVPLRAWLLKKPDWLDHQTAVGLTFAVKTFAASLLALYIAFWAGLDDPLFPSATGRPDGAMLEKLKAVAERGKLNCGHCAVPRDDQSRHRAEDRDNAQV